MKTHVEFRSDLFPPCDEDEAALNPHSFGKRLADFLVAGMREKGFEPGEPFWEDWGWVVPIENDRFKLWIGLGPYGEHQDGFLCFIEPSRPFIRRWLRKIDTTGPVLTLQKALNDVLTAKSGITEIKWWTRDEFNGPNNRRQ